MDTDKNKEQQENVDEVQERLNHYWDGVELNDQEVIIIDSYTANE